MRVDRYNFTSQFMELPSLLGEIERLLLGGNYVLGDTVLSFESDFARYLGASHACGVNSGTDALILALLAAGVGPGDEVVTQANTFYATVAAICIVGATPVLVDVDPGTFELDVAGLREAITSNTRVILPVHLYGKPGPMDAVMELATSHGLFVVEDASQAHGALYRGLRVGTIGDMGCFSFHPSKNLAAAGDAGMIVTNDDRLDADFRLRRSLGQRSQNDHIIVGYNTKIDAIQALVLKHKLAHLDYWNSARAQVASLYRETLADLPIGFQAASDDECPVYHLFPIRVSQRDALLEHLQNAKIDAVVRYPTPIHLQPAFSKCGWLPGDFPVAERLANELVCLPIRPDLRVDEVHYVCECIKRFYRV